MQTRRQPISPGEKIEEKLQKEGKKGRKERGPHRERRRQKVALREEKGEKIKRREGRDGY